MSSREVMIAGAGIGGLSLALSLHELGIPCRIFESVRVLRPLGVGINLLPHAVRELDALGLLPALRSAGVACRRLSYYTKRGEEIWSEPRGLEAGYRWPQISVHRGKLQQLLLEAVVDRLGADRVHLAHSLSGFAAGGESGQITASFDVADRSSAGSEVARTPRSVAGQLLVGADGIHSAVRRQLYPDEGPLCWNGAVLWRGTAEADVLLDGTSMIMAGHARQKFVCYPIGPPRDGAQPLNFVAELRGLSDTRLEHGNWNRAGELEDFLPAFESWRFEWLDVPALIRSAPKIWVYPMVDREPLPCWSADRITLLGDAAHPMYPIGSNGASQAILDARALAGCLRWSPEDPGAALERYESLRREATAAIVRANRRQGPEEVMQLVEDRAPDGFDDLEHVVPMHERMEIAERYKQLAGFSVEALNARPSLTEVASGTQG